MEASKTPRIWMEEQEEGKRPTGQPQKRWLDEVKRHVQKTCIMGRSMAGRKLANRIK